MFSLDHPQKSPLFDYYAPLGTHYRGLLSIPHSGENIPKEFEAYLSGDLRAYKEDVDYKVNELVDIKALQSAGIAVLVAHVHRVCVDLNRAEGNCVLFWKNNTQGKQLVVKDPSAAEVEKFIEIYHRPYFEIMKSALQDLEKRKAGKVSMVDLHSMPSRPTDYHMKQNPNQKMHRPDFCVSDRKGKTATPEFIQFFQQSLIDKGHESSLNDPYVGGYVTEYVDQFRTNNIQIEINRSVYMDETTKELVPEKVAHLRPMLTEVLIKGFEKFDS
ncbi:N-formylglutamate amidohydrolase [Peredibacter starrii]|uniref:N-formylglutamate amidohydrolase n=1 Tax=Peredibacter starrii TaxID=28202 RepID=A0AAX4HIX7_9BACT|nr:N-formylglutamate amidohydrolase [Peredibacter starrii]WPU63185.1 N-formylglutamate amidohydrolase [Peredibacter starrii]